MAIALPSKYTFSVLVPLTHSIVTAWNAASSSCCSPGKGRGPLIIPFQNRCGSETGTSYLLYNFIRSSTGIYCNTVMGRSMQL